MAGKPAQKFRAGQVSCALWENEISIDGRRTKALRATFERRYKDAGGEWKSSDSFSRNELPLAMLVLQRAFEYMIDQANVKAEDAVVEEELAA